MSSLLQWTWSCGCKQTEERECAIVDIAVEEDKGIVEKVKKYQEFKGTLQGCGTRELCRWYRSIQIVVGSFARVTKNLEKWLESWTQEFVFHCPQKTTLLGTERILRKVLVSSRVRSRNLRVLFSWVMTRSLSKTTTQWDQPVHKARNNNNNNDDDDNNSNLNDNFNTCIVNKGNRTEWSQETT